MKHVKSLSETHSKLAKEWSDRNFPFTADDETAGSSDLVWWHGLCGHEWYASVYNRAREGLKRGTGCPYCSGKKVLKGFNDFASKYPELVKEWSSKNYPLKPDMFTRSSTQKAIWICSKGHEWKTTISNRTQGNGCPICAKEPVVPGVDDLFTIHPEIAAEWSEKNLPLTPDMIKAEYKKQVFWKCRLCGEEYECQPYSRTHNSVICPHCRKMMLTEPTKKNKEKPKTKRKTEKTQKGIPMPSARPILPETEICEALKEGVSYFGQGNYKKHINNIDDINQVRIWEKYTISIEEASLYFGISVNTLRDIVKAKPDAAYLTYFGKGVYIIREAFEKLLDSENKLLEVTE